MLSSCLISSGEKECGGKVETEFYISEQFVLHVSDNCVTLRNNSE